MQNITIKDWLTSVRKLGQVTKRVIADAWPSNERYISGMAALTIVISCSSYVGYWLYGKLVGSLANPAGRSMAIWYVLATIAMSYASNLLNVLEGLMERLLHHRMQTRFNILFFSRKAAVGVDMLENPDFRDTVSKAQDNLIYPILNIAEGVYVHLSNFVRLSVAMVIVGVYDWKLCLFACVALIPQFLVDIRHGRAVWGIFEAETETRRRFSEIRRHFFGRNGLIELKLFQNVGFFLDRMKTILVSFQESQEKAEKKRFAGSIAATTVSSVLIGAIIVTVVIRVAHGSMPIASFVFLWGSIQSLQGTLSGALRDIARQNEQALYAANNYEVIDAKPETAERTGSIVCADKVPTIEFDHVSFSYPWDDQNRKVLNDVSLKIHPGEHLALVGINGAGKTTLIKLMCGIYVPTKGRILIDGVDLHNISLKSWQRQIAGLMQSYSNYQLKVREIIALGDTSVEPTEERIRAAAVASGADSFIPDLPYGYETMVGKDFEGGVDLSGGQYQRMALARVFYRQGKVVVLDEPTASLDAFVEAQIFEDIEKQPRNATLILITHRLSSIRNSDRIVVLEKGSVVEIGPHTKLMERNGLYSEMFLKQARGYMIQPVEKEKDDE